MSLTSLGAKCHDDVSAERNFQEVNTLAELNLTLRMWRYETVFAKIKRVMDLPSRARGRSIECRDSIHEPSSAICE